jgi:hypothetical protein
VSVDKLNSVLGYRPERGEFLTGLIQDAIGRGKAGGKPSEIIGH